MEKRYKNIHIYNKILKYIYIIYILCVYISHIIYNYIFLYYIIYSCAHKYFDKQFSERAQL